MYVAFVMGFEAIPSQLINGVTFTRNFGQISSIWEEPVIHVTCKWVWIDWELNFASLWCLYKFCKNQDLTDETCCTVAFHPHISSTWLNCDILTLLPVAIQLHCLWNRDVSRFRLSEAKGLFSTGWWVYGGANHYGHIPNIKSVLKCEFTQAFTKYLMW